MLLSVGHEWPEIQNYTVSQLNYFALAARKHQGVELQLMALAARGEEQAFKQTVQELNGDS